MCARWANGRAVLGVAGRRGRSSRGVSQPRAGCAASIENSSGQSGPQGDGSLLETSLGGMDLLAGMRRELEERTCIYLTTISVFSQVSHEMLPLRQLPRFDPGKKGIHLSVRRSHSASRRSSSAAPSDAEPEGSCRDRCRRLTYEDAK
jgi:hypothetical protein